jgi:signal transduction histidine kinase
MRLPSLGIRARTTLVASVAVGFALFLGAGVLVFLMTHALRSSIESAAATRASDVALLAKSGSLPQSLPGHGDALLVQVVSAGKVVSSSRDLAGRPPLVSIELAPNATRIQELPSIPDLEQEPAQDIELDPSTPFVVIARGVATPHGEMTVLAASSLSPLEDIDGVVVPLLLASAPFALALVAGITWLLTGMALRPVDAMRERAETISSSAPGELLPVPPAKDEIRDLAETMNRMLQRIESSTAAQKRFVSDASHELKSPIAAIRTMAEVARTSPSVIDLPTFLDDLAAEDERLELLVADLLLLATTDEGHLAIEPVPIDLARTVSQEVLSVSAKTSVSVCFEPSGSLVIEADEGRIRQLVRNLLENAVRHATSTVWVAVESGEAVVAVLVSDDGPGMPREAWSRVFERFVRIDEGRSRYDGGTGLGLPVCRAIASAHYGSVEIIEPLHGGATFRVQLPLNTPR